MAPIGTVLSLRNGLVAPAANKRRVDRTGGQQISACERRANPRRLPRPWRPTGRYREGRCGNVSRDGTWHCIDRH